MGKCYKAKIFKDWCPKCRMTLTVREGLYCPSCGKKMRKKPAKNCPLCGAYLGPTDHFCDNCGKPVVGVKKSR